MGKGKEYDIRGEWYCGDSLKEKLTVDMLPAVDLVQKLEEKIKSLRSLYFEFVVVELQDEGSVDKDYPLFFQTKRNQSYLKTDTYQAEIGMKSKGGTILYAQVELPLSSVLELFRKICVRREKPNKSEWIKGKGIYRDEKPTGVDTTEIEKYEVLLSNYWQNLITGKELDFAEHEMLQHVAFEAADPYYIDALSRKYEKDGMYNELNSLFETHSHHPVVAQIRGEMELHGIFGKPNYKKAYEYFIHAKKIGSLLAEYYIAIMYKHGLYVKKNHDKYVKILRSLYSKYQNFIVEACPSQIQLELSKAEQSLGNEEAALECCLRALQTQKWLLDCGFGNIERQTVDIVQQVHDLGYFDPYEMDLLDLLCVLKKPCTVNIGIEGQEIEVHSYYNNGRVIVRCGDKYYRDPLDFLRKHKWGEKFLSTYIKKVDYMEIM